LDRFLREGLIFAGGMVIAGKTGCSEFDGFRSHELIPLKRTDYFKVDWSLLRGLFLSVPRVIPKNYGRETV
jgi:hypothetical protein